MDKNIIMSMTIYFIFLVIIINIKSCVVEIKLKEINTNIQQIKQGMTLYAEFRTNERMVRPEKAE